VKVMYLPTTEQSRRLKVQQMTTPSTRSICTPLSLSFSSQGTLSCMILQTRRDLNGGICLDQMSLAQFRSREMLDLNIKASFKVRVLVLECFKLAHHACLEWEWLLVAQEKQPVER
jgi:hypothetical protein